MRFLLSATLLVALSLMTAGSAQAYNGMGPGYRSCGAWIADRGFGPNDPMSLSEQAWVLGFLSGVASTGTGNPLAEVVDPEAVAAWIDNYCRTHLLDPIAQAATMFFAAHPR
jgi:hypothetical protein